MEPLSDSPRAGPKPQSRACEACRAAKIRCQAGPQPGICKRCSDFKRECVFRTGPRTRRSKVASNGHEAALPPPPGPSKTFSIDFSMPADPEPGASFDELREQHERFIDDLVPSSEEEAEEGQKGPSLSSPTAATFNFASLPTPASTTTASPASRPMVDLGIKPQFNLDSAEKLLQTFRGMLLSCPCIVLEDGASVRTMARDSPFVLLAILAATSCTTSLQGHSLYDEEFRKVLGLKFVTSGERTLDLLQGILVYCAWYPFHLRPKHRQAYQYLKMATDIARDLEADQQETLESRIEIGLTSEDLAGIRAYISCYYMITIFSNSFTRGSSFPYSAWLAKCCDLLEQQSSIEQDHVLVWLVRLHHIADEMLALQRDRKKGEHSDHHRHLIQKGLESQLREWQSQIPTSISLMPCVMMSSLFSEMHILAAPLNVAPRIKPAEKFAGLDPVRLMEAVPIVRSFFDLILTLPQSTMAQFCGADRVHLIVSIILAYRLSLPIDQCPEFDSAKARRLLDFGSYLEKLCKEPDDDSGGKTDTNRKKTDVCTAFRVVLRSLKTKFLKKVAAAEAKEEVQRRAQECPMFDGSLDDYIALWDGHGMPIQSSSHPTSQSGLSGVPTDPIVGFSPPGSHAKSPVFDDLWSTMTLDWSGELIPDLGIGDAQVDYGNF